MSERITAEINLMENAAYIVKDGALIQLQSPPSGYGQQTIHWESEKVTRIVHGHIQKI